MKYTTPNDTPHSQSGFIPAFFMLSCRSTSFLFCSGFCCSVLNSFVLYCCFVFVLEDVSAGGLFGLIIALNRRDSNGKEDFIWRFPTRYLVVFLLSPQLNVCLFSSMVGWVSRCSGGLRI